MARYTGSQAIGSDDGTGQDDDEVLNPPEHCGAPAHFCACEREGAATCFAAELRAGADIDSFCKRLAI